MVQMMRRFSFRLLHSQTFGLIIVGIAFLLFLASLFDFNGSGSKAWILLPIGITQVTLQPSEFAKVALILIIAAYTGDVKKTFKDKNYIWKRPFFIGLGYAFIVLVLQHDFGSAVVMGTICVVCILIPSHPQLRSFQKFIGWFYAVGMLFAVFLLSPLGEPVIRHLPLEDYQISRILSAIDPFQDQYNTGYQLILGLIAFAAGGWKGLGYGASVRKYTRFPAANTDFILAIIVEELGIFGFLAVMIPYTIIVVQLFRYALKMRSEQGKIILVGVAMYIVIHSLFNIGGVTGLIPLTGVPLLMISSGGSSTMSLMAALGIAQAVILRWNRGEFQ
jgi:cell division protein FtsW